MSARPTLRRRAGLLLIRVAGWLATHGLRLVGASSLLVETPEYAREREAAAERSREAFSRALGISAVPVTHYKCPCPRCTQQRAQAAGRWN